MGSAAAPLAAGAGRSVEDFGEELFKLGKGEATGDVPSNLPPLQGVEIKAPCGCGFRLAEAPLFAGCFETLGDIHVEGLGLRGGRFADFFLAVDCIVLFERRLMPSIARCR